MKFCPVICLLPVRLFGRQLHQRSGMTWALMDRFAAEWLPEPKILHPHPYLRFDAKYLR
jgi:hypothetical protein